MTGASPAGHDSCRTGLPASRCASHSPHAQAMPANGHAAGRGIPLASTAQGASPASSRCAPITQREGRHSRRQAADVLDQGVECVIGGGFMAEEPAPEPIVLAIQQA